MVEGRHRRRWALVTTTTVAAAAVAAALSLSGCSGVTWSDHSAPPGAIGRPTVPAVTPSAPAESSTATAAPSGVGRLVVEPDDGSGPIYQFISSARRALDMTMYELADPVAEAALEADAARGVVVRVLLDEKYSGGAVNAQAAEHLSAGGVHVAWAFSGEIFHQKSITVDDSKTMIMTGNLTARYYATTRDFAVVDSDPADVASIESTFADDFAGDAPGRATTGDDLVWSPGSEGALVALIDSARHSVVTESEEMDSTAIDDALEGDARRGVVVDVVMTATPRWAPAFDSLTAAGVHVIVYRGESPRYIHAKVTLVDAGFTGQRAFLGSQNFSPASMEYDRELGIVTSEPGVLARLASVLSVDVAGGVRWG